ncbi:hypothetical protein OPT61_g7764 [Boeremia exigua]|uniref:Uncharacterized protein n=1 Tax=Boeremia exigua TaxID=749465 RepID=A0ACC2I227_9PLEO|nr:hypothetical protein OPT61_g7764 [Boeremia exigua]
MFTRIWRATTHQRHARGDYHRASAGETTEPQALTVGSNEELAVNSLHAKRAPDVRSITSAESKSSSLQRYKHRFSGWRFGVLNFAVWASIVFLINLVVTIWGSLAHKGDQRVLYEGDCKRTKSLNSGLHLLINILSTILLSGSNYCMQCLSAPTRSEVDLAHGARRWLDIGVPSLRNLRRISRRRFILWLLLATSSLPLHLLYNSSIYASIASNSYYGMMVKQAFVDAPACENCTSSDPISKFDTQMAIDLWDKLQSGLLDRLEPAECLNAYGVTVQSTRRSLFVIVTANENDSPEPQSLPFYKNTNTNVLTSWYSDASRGLQHYGNTGEGPIRWLCSGITIERPARRCLDRFGELSNSTQPWTIGGRRVDYCLSEKAEPRCRLHFSPLIAIIVTALNFFKALLMFYVVYSLEDNPLMTMGDAVASFLDKRDATTEYVGLISIRDAKRGYSAGATTWEDPRRRWKDATSKSRRTITALMFTIALGTVLGLLIFGVRELNQYMSTTTYEAFRLGFGAVDQRTMIFSLELPTDMAGLALIANSPQVILSFLYFAYNNLFTAMLLAYEWTSYAHKRKGLRVSRRPTGSQRSTYFLQLPYRFGLPLVVLSGMLHWLVSQSIFLVAFDLYDSYGKPMTDLQRTGYTAIVTHTVGFSPIAMLAVIAVGVAMVVALIGFGFIPFKPGMPLAGSCSLAISAACHPEHHAGAGYVVLSEQKLQWGVVSTGVDGIGHCAFSTKEVGPLVKGRMYA